MTGHIQELGFSVLISVSTMVTSVKSWMKIPTAADAMTRLLNHHCICSRCWSFLACVWVQFDNQTLLKYTRTILSFKMVAYNRFCIATMTVFCYTCTSVQLALLEIVYVNFAFYWHQQKFCILLAIVEIVYINSAVSCMLPNQCRATCN